jgi:hypothetical protein
MWNGAFFERKREDFTNLQPNSGVLWLWHVGCLVSREQANFMSKVKVGIKDQPIVAKIQMLRQRVIDLTGNPNFPTPTPSLAQLTATADSLETAYNDARTAREIAKAKTALQDEASAAADLLYSQLSNYVDFASGGVAAKIESAGFSVRAGNRPLGELPSPASIEIRPGEHPGAVELRWKGIRGARAYTIQKAADAEGELNWQPAVNVTKPRASVNSMTSGKKYWFRVAPIGAAGQGPWSDAIAKVVA